MRENLKQLTGRKNSVLKKGAVLLCLLLVAVLTVCSGCGYKGYSGVYADLYTVAIHSVLWNVGHSYTADWFCDSQIEVLETDEYGRVIFTYYEDDHSALSFSSLIISQYSTDEFVYYYEDLNFLNKEQKVGNQLQDFSDVEINYLKNLNDWGKELDLKKCTQKNIVRNKENMPADNESIEEQMRLKFNYTGYTFLRYLTSDINDNFIVYGSLSESNYTIYLVAFVDSEGTVIDWLVPVEPYNYQSELKEFKFRNGWTNK